MTGGETIGASTDTIITADDLLADPESIPDGLVLARLDEIQARRVALKADEARWLAIAEQRKLYKPGGHATMFGLLRSRFGWSEGQCKSAMAAARGGARFPWLLEAVADGSMPTAHFEVLTSAALTLERLGHEDVDTALGFLANEAGLEHDQFCKEVRRWVAISRSERASGAAASRRERRSATITLDDDGATLHAELDALDGAELLEILAHFSDAEFRADCDTASATHGAHVDTAPLARTDRQRQADALMNLARTAANASAAMSGDHEPLVTILVDERTFNDTVTELQWAATDHPTDQQGRHDRSASNDVLEGDPLVWSQRRCETSNGVVIDPRTAVLAALLGEVRWMMVDRLGTPLAVSSKQRFFRGPLRAAIMSISDRCICPGCRRRTGASEADHLDEHHLGGATALVNGGPVCGRHNRFKSRHNYRPRRDHRGQWHLYDQHGHPVT